MSSARPTPDLETILAALDVACRAPSVHNTQPWRWAIAEHSVHLFADGSRRLPVVDPDGREMTISCGAALHHARVA
ncbi:MAG: Acg family FMN-binding oxidoreductase, partial [Mycobacteriaceae bacterium]